LRVVFCVPAAGNAAFTGLAPEVPVFEPNRFRVAVLATGGFEASEVTEPAKALQQARAQVTILSPRPGEIGG
jgi:hypothetical protein